MANQKQETILITGIGGFIGLAAARRARQLGLKVRGLELDPDKARLASEEGAEVITGNITRIEDLQKACAGVDTVLHTAAVVKEGGALEFFRRINVEGTINLARIARENGARVFIHLSSVMVYGFHFPPDVDEDGPLKGDNNPYCMTKIEGEAALLELNSPPAFGVIIIRPGDVYGPGSVPWVIRPLQLMRKRLFALPSGGRGIINHVYVENLLDGIFLAWSKKAFGRPFNITDGAGVTWREYYTRLAKTGGAPRPLALPDLLIRAGAWLVMTFQKLKGQEPDLRPQGVDFINRNNSYSIERARRELGYSPAVDLDEGLRITGEWIEKNLSATKKSG